MSVEKIGHRKKHQEKASKINKTTIYLIAVLVIIFIIQLTTLIPLHQLPSPLLGGDYYYQLGCVNHVKYGGNVFENCNLLSPNPGYFPLYALIVGGFARITGTSAIASSMIFSMIFTLLSAIISFFTIKKIFKLDWLATIGSLLFTGSAFVMFKYTNFGRYVMTPLLVLVTYLFYEKQNWKNTIILGVTIGLALLTHSIFLPVSYFVLFMLFLYMIFFDEGKRTIKDIKQKIKKLLPYFITIFAISFLIGLLYWYNPLFIHHAHTSEHYLEWNGPGDVSKLPLQLHLFKQIIKGSFFAFNSLLTSIISILVLLGLIAPFFIKDGKEKGIKFTKFMFLTGYIITFSYFITEPLFGIHFVPDYIFSVFVKFLLVLFASYTIYVIYKVLKEYQIPHLQEKIIFVALLILIIFSCFSLNEHNKKSQWYSYGQTRMDPFRISMENYIVKNTNVNDVFLTTKEDGFMLNALTGRKLVDSRRAQNDAFENMDKREMAAAVILYGNNDTLRKELIKKYHIKYLYWDYYWINSEFQFDKKGRIIGSFDPLIAFNNKTYRELLNKTNVSYYIRNTYVDPSLRSKYHPTFDLITISPKNYRSAYKPWNKELDKFLEPVWSVKDNKGQPIAVIYKINLNESE